MGVIEADALQAILEAAKNWPIWSADTQTDPYANSAAGTYAQVGKYGSSMRDLELWIALREADRPQIRRLINWDPDREYRVDPLPERITNAFQDLVYGEDPTFKAAVPEDQEELDAMIEANDLPSELRRWLGECVSEGEVWWRIYVDPLVSDYPIVDSSSRVNVIPYFLGRRIAAAAFVEDIRAQAIEVEGQVQHTVYRHVEIQTDGLVRNALYKGGINDIGNQMPLSTLPETQNLEEEWNHGLKVMLAGRYPFKLGRDWRLGISVLHGIKDMVLDLNEAHVIMAENARLTSQARMIVPTNALDENGKYGSSKNVIVEESMDGDLDGKKGSYTVLEYEFQAGPLLTHIDNLINTALTRVGLAEQFVGGGKSMTQGQAFTGTALRTRLIPTTLAAAGVARPWDDGVPKMLQAMQMVSALPTERLGTGQQWNSPDKKPSMKRSSVLPEDQNEQTQRLVMAVQGEIKSIESAVREEHPDWEQSDIDDEVEAIRNDRSMGLDGDITDLPNGPEGGPGSVVPGPSDIGGARQPGVTGGSTGPDGQTPGKRPPAVKAGGPS